MLNPQPLTTNPYQPAVYWKAPVRLLHWVIAASLAGAAFLTTPDNAGHAAVGWIALGALLIRLFAASRADAPDPALWAVSAAVLILDLSGWLVPDGILHWGASLVVLVLAALYCATVLFETVQRFTMHTPVLQPAAGIPPRPGSRVR